MNRMKYNTPSHIYPNGITAYSRGIVAGILMLAFAGVCLQDIVAQETMKTAYTNALPETDAEDSPFYITGEGIPDSGITSAYYPHSFHIGGEGKADIQTIEWQYFLPSADGTETLTASSKDKTFDIDAVSSPDIYQINDDGTIHGRIVFTGKVNGNDMTLQYNITLEQKPHISKVEFERRANPGYDTYDVSCKVDYRGADYLFVSVEEEYGATSSSQFVREPYIADFVCKDITSPYSARIDITAENQYGRDVYTIELPPYGNPSAKIEPTAVDRTGNDSFTEIRIFNAHGQHVRTIRDFSETKSLAAGLYLLEYRKGNRTIKASKLLK